MRATLATLKVVLSWLDTIKTLSTDQKTVATDDFGVDDNRYPLLCPRYPMSPMYTKGFTFNSI